MTIHIARPGSGSVADESLCVNADGPDGGLAEMERAQAALREGIERARKMLREARVEMGTLDVARPGLPGCRLVAVPRGRPC